jgi:2-hydroxychromene-2-carboxylate isomerase
VADPRLKVVRVSLTPSPAAAQPIFYYDLGSPACYLAAERIMSALPVAPEWEPVAASAFGAGPERQHERDRELIVRLASERGLQPIRWPTPWPPETHTAMLAATYAKGIGRAVAFSLAAFRQAFAGGRDLGDENTILIAAAACEIHPAAMLKGIAMRSVATALEEAGERATAARVRSLPAVLVGDRVFHGEAGIDQAAGELSRTSAQ